MAAATPVNRQWRLKSRPTGLIKADNFELVSEPMPVPEEAQLLIRSVYLSLDPAMRGWLIDRPSYVPPVQIGEIMRGLAIGIVEKKIIQNLPPVTESKGCSAGKNICFPMVKL
jgi:NADPH-dependent curcumin reductase CurA